MAHPFVDERFTFTQPDGSTLDVIGWGDQDHAVFETLDGYTVVQDPITGFFRYGELSPAGSEIQPTSLRADFAMEDIGRLQKHLRLPRHAAKTQADIGSGLPKPEWMERRENARGVRLMSAIDGIGTAPPQRQTIGNKVGLCLLIAFPELSGSVEQAEVTAFCNSPSYSGFGNKGSVRDYFLDNSIGRLNYSTVVAPYYTTKHPRSYYTDPKVPYGRRARELIEEVLAFHVSQGFDFRSLSTDAQDHVFAINVFYAGRRVNAWGQGLWPHASRLMEPMKLAPGIHALDYQMTDLAEHPTLGTYCHENGHMLCDFPDLYDYGAPGSKSGGVGSYCLMCGGANADKYNPTQICAYLKYEAGWAGSVTEISGSMQAPISASGNHFYRFAKSQDEYFIIENRQRSGRDAALPDSGLAIWHVDVFGNNSNEQMTSSSHYECSLEQADGQFDLERGDHHGDDRDLYHAGWKDVFSGATNPASNWWDGTASGLSLHSIGQAQPNMTFVTVSREDLP